MDDTGERFVWTADDVTIKRKKPVDVVIHEHGELGPVLAVKGEHFTTEDDL